MKMVFAVTLLAAVAVVHPLFAQKSAEDENKRIAEALTALDEIMAAADKSVPRSVMEKAEGIAVFPSLIKGGVGIGGQHGRGILSVRDKKTGSRSSPAFLTINGGSIASWGLTVRGQNQGT